jgi:hypothetical protein
MDKKSDETPLSPIAKEIEENAEKIKDKLKHVETKESNKLPTAAGNYYCLFYLRNVKIFFF